MIPCLSLWKCKVVTLKDCPMGIERAHHEDDGSHQDDDYAQARLESH